jgi:phosphohistidine phosphatase
MRVYLVQHGQAMSEDQDPGRHLTEKGIADVRKISLFLKNAQIRVDAIWHSGKARALQTAEILAERIISKHDVIEHKGLSPNDNIMPVKNELHESDADIMIVGHLPFLSKLASSLVIGNESAQLISFQQGGLVCIEKAEDKTWKIRWMIVPELLP